MTLEAPELQPRSNQLPPIRRALLIPCYDDLKPVIAKSDSITSIMDADATTFERAQECYLRQFNLIVELKRREQSN